MTKKKETTKKLSKKEAKKIADEAAALIANENRIPTPSEIKNEEDGLIFKIIIQNSSQFPVLIIKTKNPKISSLVVSSGKLVITGAKSTDMVHEAVYVVMGILRDSGTTIDDDPEIIVQNIVASGNFNKRTINLELASMWLESSMYEPEQFPGLIYRLPIPKTVLLLFQSGNLVCTGAKTEDQVHEAVRKTYDDLDEIEAFDT